MRTRPPTTAATLKLVVLLAAIGVAVLQVARGSDAPEAVEVAVQTRGGAQGTATLVRQGDRWLGRVSDFPAGSVAHVQPRSGPGFFLVRAASRTFRAYADRSPHRGQPLEYREPLPGTANTADGPQPGFYDPQAGANHTLDAEPFAGPAPRPLDPFPVLTDGDRLAIGIHAVCPSDLALRPAWCGASENDGPRALPAGQAVVLLLPRSSVEVLSEPGLRAGADPVRRLTEQELRAWGFEVAHTASDLERPSAAGARVLWLHQAALGQVDPAWVRARYAEGRAVGVLDGTVADLVNRFGLGENAAGWIQPGGTRPVFALVLTRSSSCPGSFDRGQTSDWLSLSWLLGATRSALSNTCPPGPNAHANHVQHAPNQTAPNRV